MSKSGDQNVMAEKRNHANVCGWVLRCLSGLLCLVGTYIIIIIIVVSSGSVTTAGWTFFSLGLLAFLTGISGLSMRKGMQSCFCIRTLFLLLGSISFLTVFVLCISAGPEKVFKSVRPKKWAQRRNRRKC
jgi:hypothetical protein